MSNEFGETLPQLKWQRTNFNDFPKVWYTFKARDVDSDDIVEYRIQDLPLDRADDLLDHLVNSYVIDEPVGQAMENQNDPHATEDYKNYWRPIIKQGITIVCFKEGSDEIVGANMLFINTKDDTYSDDIRKFFKGHVAVKLFEFMDVLCENFDTFEKYNVDQYMSTMGLSVAREYRGRSIGSHFFNTRLELCREFGITLIQHGCSSDYSNAVADRAGYDTDITMSYFEIAAKYPGFEKFVNAKAKRLTMRSLRV